MLLILDPLAFNSYCYFLVVKFFSASLELPLNIWSFISVLQGKTLLTKTLGPQVKNTQLIENPLLPSYFVTKYKYMGLQVRVFFSEFIDYFEMIGNPLSNSMSVANVNILNLKVRLTGVRQPQWWRWDLMLVKTKNSWISVKLSITLDEAFLQPVCRQSFLCGSFGNRGWRSIERRSVQTSMEETLVDLVTELFSITCLKTHPRRWHG